MQSAVCLNIIFSITGLLSGLVWTSLDIIILMITGAGCFVDISCPLYHEQSLPFRRHQLYMYHMCSAVSLDIICVTYAVFCLSGHSSVSQVQSICLDIVCIMSAVCLSERYVYHKCSLSV